MTAKNPVHSQVLHDHRFCLHDNCSLVRLLPVLLSAEVISTEEYARLTHIKTSKMILEVLMKKPESNFWKLLESFKETGHEFMAEHLKVSYDEKANKQKGAGQAESFQQPYGYKQQIEHKALSPPFICRKGEVVSLYEQCSYLVGEPKGRPGADELKSDSPKDCRRETSEITSTDAKIRILEKLKTISARLSKVKHMGVDPAESGMENTQIQVLVSHLPSPPPDPMPTLILVLCPQLQEAAGGEFQELQVLNFSASEITPTDVKMRILEKLKTISTRLSSVTQLVYQMEMEMMESLTQAWRFHPQSQPPDHKSTLILVLCTSHQLQEAADRQFEKFEVLNCSASEITPTDVNIRILKKLRTIIRRHSSVKQMFNPVISRMVESLIKTWISHLQSQPPAPRPSFQETTVPSLQVLETYPQLQEAGDTRPQELHDLNSSEKEDPGNARESSLKFNIFEERETHHFPEENVTVIIPEKSLDPGIRGCMAYIVPEEPLTDNISDAVSKIYEFLPDGLSTRKRMMFAIPLLPAHRYNYKSMTLMYRKTKDSHFVCAESMKDHKPTWLINGNMCYIFTDHFCGMCVSGSGSTDEPSEITLQCMLFFKYSGTRLELITTFGCYAEDSACSVNKVVKHYTSSGYEIAQQRLVVLNKASNLTVEPIYREEDWKPLFIGDGTEMINGPSFMTTWKYCCSPAEHSNICFSHSYSQQNNTMDDKQHIGVRLIHEQCFKYHLSLDVNINRNNVKHRFTWTELDSDGSIKAIFQRYLSEEDMTTCAGKMSKPCNAGELSREEFIEMFLDTFACFFPGPNDKRRILDSFIAYLEDQFPCLERLIKELSNTRATANSPPTEFKGATAVSEEEDGDGKLKIVVMPINKNDPKIQSLLKDNGVYHLHRKPRGRAVILNIQHFTLGHERKGSQYDATNLENLLQQLHFETVVYDDLKAKKIKETIKQEKKKIKKEDDAFILCALSHGGEKKGKHYIRGKDRKEVYVEEDLCEPFNGKNCKALLTKPKIFIIQSCRGGKDTKGVEATDDIPDTEEEDGCLMVHKDTDVLIARSTISKYVSYRDEDLGSRFIRTLVRVFAAQAHTKHIVDMLTEVRRKVNDDKTKLQVPEDTLRLEKSFYFFPGYPTE